MRGSRAGKSGALIRCVIACCAACAVLPAAPAIGAELPNGRIYEQVTPEEKLGSEVYQPPVTTNTHSEFEVPQNTQAESVTETEYTFQAAADGNAIAYVATPTVEGNENQGLHGGNEYLATRTPTGAWSQRVLSPAGAPNAIFEAFSPSLTTGIVESGTPLSPLAPGLGEAEGGYGNYDVLYSVATAGGAYTPLFTTKPPYRAMGYFGTAGPFEAPAEGLNSNHSGRHHLALEGASAQYTHLLFAANDALTSASEGRPAAEGGAAGEFEKEDNLYESTGGQLRLVNVLPDGSTHADAGFGNGSPPFRRVISADGSRVFWTDLSTGHIYMREDGTKTVEVSPEGTYQTATSDGSAAFYTNGDLYRYEPANGGETTDLTPGVNVSAVVGASENGEYVYYTTSSGALSLWHAGASVQITTQPLMLTAAAPTVEVTPDGHSVVFMRQELKKYPEGNNPYVYRVEVYDATTETLYCASCTSRGNLGQLQATNAQNVYQPRWITTDGAHVFFVSHEGLVPGDSNGTQDVYEWERPGTGGCSESGGCVHLLSGGTSPAHSSFLDASESGEDVFIVTRADLTGDDEDGLFDLYDIRVGQAPPVPPACTGTGCQGIPQAPPTFATPPTVTFNGLGNFPSPPQASHNKQAKRKAEQRHKRRLRQAKRRRAVKRCRAQHGKSRRKRKVCERKARAASSAAGKRARPRHHARDHHHNGRSK